MKQVSAIAPQNCSQLGRKLEGVVLQWHPRAWCPHNSRQGTSFPAIQLKAVFLQGNPLAHINIFKKSVLQHSWTPSGSSAAQRRSKETAKDMLSLSISRFQPWMVAFSSAVVNLKGNCDIRIFLIIFVNLLSSSTIFFQFLLPAAFFPNILTSSSVLTYPSRQLMAEGALTFSI